VLGALYSVPKAKAKPIPNTARAAPIPVIADWLSACACLMPAGFPGYNGP